jgi:putative inorganic carbon (HCO3(-)) transporter
MTMTAYVIRPGDWVAGASIRWNLILNMVGVLTFLSLLLQGNATRAADRTWAYLVAFWLLMMLSSVAHGQFATISIYTPQMLTNLCVFFLLCASVDGMRKFYTVAGTYLLLSLFVVYQCHIQMKAGTNIAGLPPLTRYAGIEEFADGSTRVLTTLQARWVGVFNDPNDVGLLFVALLPLALVKGALMKGPLLLRLIWLAAAAALIYGVFLTDSRGTFLAFMSAVGFFWIIRYRSTWGAIVAGMGGFAMLTLGPSRMSSLTAGDDSAMERVYIWIEALEYFAWKPFFGTGPLHWLDYHHLTTHNSYVLAFVENGFFAYMCWLAVIVIPMFCGISVSLQANEKSLRIESAAVTASYIGVLTSIFFISRTYILIPFFIGAMTMAFCRIRSPEVLNSTLQRISPMIVAITASASIVGMWITNRLTTMLIL